MFKKIVLPAFLMLTSSLFSQVAENIEYKMGSPAEAFNNPNHVSLNDFKYISLETGIGRSTFRDLATSPLFYSGFTANFKLSFLKQDSERERQFYMHYSFGNYSDDRNSNQSKVRSFFIGYSKLFRIESLSNQKWNTKAGGKIDITANVRNNASLQNNAYGVEFFGNVMGSIQTTRNLSRHEPNPKKFWFINYGRKTKIRSISARFNVGLLNTNYRNGFIYSQQYQVVNKIEVFEGYKFHVNGLRLGTTIDFTRFFDKGNGIRFSYNWDAYRTSYKFEGFDMAHHTFSFALLFRTK